MKIEDQVCTIQQGHKLRSLGINGALAHFNHAGYYPDPTGQHEGYTIVMDEYHELCAVSEKIAPAFTVAELGVMLPGFPNYSWQTYYHSSDEEWRANNGYGEHDGSCQNEAAGRANILIFLLETNRIVAIDCNKRLEQ